MKFNKIMNEIVTSKNFDFYNSENMLILSPIVKSALKNQKKIFLRRPAAQKACQKRGCRGC